jgi:hypothetical protein
MSEQLPEDWGSTKTVITFFGDRRIRREAVLLTDTIWVGAACQTTKTVSSGYE